MFLPPPTHTSGSFTLPNFCASLPGVVARPLLLLPPFLLLLPLLQVLHSLSEAATDQCRYVPGENCKSPVYLSTDVTKTKPVYFTCSLNWRDRVELRLYIRLSMRTLVTHNMWTCPVGTDGNTLTPSLFSHTWCELHSPHTCIRKAHFKSWFIPLSLFIIDNSNQRSCKQSPAVTATHCVTVYNVYVSNKSLDLLFRERSKQLQWWHIIHPQMNRLKSIICFCLTILHPVNKPQRHGKLQFNTRLKWFYCNTCPTDSCTAVSL